MLVHWLEKQLQISKREFSHFASLWLVIGFPALFTLIEYLIPKLFPWNIGHCLFEQLFLIQTADITGSYYFSFCVFSLGAAIGGIFGWPYKMKKVWITFPLLLITINCLYGISKRQSFADLKQLDVSLIQANIGNFDKVASTKGVESKLDFILNSYFELTEKALKDNPNTQLIIWPETALPFGFQKPTAYSERVWEKVKAWGKPFITGGYAMSLDYPPKDYNGAYLLEPAKYPMPSQIYFKNILLAFGEYMPFGELFPVLYSYFPEVSNFSAGTTQEVFALNAPDPIRLGMNICYEAILPSFIRKVADNNPHIFINLTNDSWFGPTSEPYLHGALTTFRAIEHRLPFVRSTNTGTSFIVGVDGEVKTKTPTYEPAFLNQKVSYFANPNLTFYQMCGDWFIVVCLLALFILFFIGRKNVSLDH
jgi:apolipoprotein N-acyltransferase